MIRFAYKKYKARAAKRTDASPNPQETRSAAGRKLCEHQKQANADVAIKAEKEATASSTTTDNTVGQARADTTCQACKADRKRRRVYRWKLMIALFPPAFLAAVDTTIVATALTTIASHFDQLSQFNWIVTAYTLTATAFIPAFGQIADIFGRHFALQLSMFFMLIGSTLCAAAQSWTMLLFGRALQGFSSAGIMNIIKIVLADKVSLAEQSKNSTIFSLVSGISYAVGPVIGGSLAFTNWRYCFVVSIPVAVLAHVLIFVLLRKELIRGTHHLTGPERKSLLSGLSTIDYGGTFLFIFGAGLLILGTSWGGATHPWSSPQVLAPLVIGSVLFILFFVYEYLLEPGRLIGRMFPTQVAMLPWKLFERRDVILLAVINAATGASLYSAFYFVGIFWTLVEKYDPEKAGYQLLYYTPGIGVGVYSAMFMCNIFPRQTFYPIFTGSVVEAVGFSVLAWATSMRKPALVSVMMAISGAGTGLRFMPVTLHATGIWPNKLASVMSLLDFTMPFGGTLSIAIMSSVFYNKFAAALASLNLSKSISGTSPRSAQSLQGINSLPNNVQTLLRERAARAVMWSFISVLPLMGLSVVCGLFLGNVWIKPKKPVNGSEAQGAVIYSSYLTAAFTGKLKRRKVPVDVRDDAATL